MLPARLTAIPFGDVFRLVDELGLTRARVPFDMHADAAAARQFAEALAAAYTSIRNFQIEQQEKGR